MQYKVVKAMESIYEYRVLVDLFCQTLVPVDGDSSIDFISLVKGWLTSVCQLLGSKTNLIREGELAAFLSYAIAYPHNFLPVIDSYSVTW